MIYFVHLKTNSHLEIMLHEGKIGLLNSIIWVDLLRITGLIVESAEASRHPLSWSQDPQWARLAALPAHKVTFVFREASVWFQAPANRSTRITLSLKLTNYKW